MHTCLNSSLWKRHLWRTSLGIILECSLFIVRIQPVYNHKVQYALRKQKTGPGELDLGLYWNCLWEPVLRTHIMEGGDSCVPAVGTGKTWNVWKYEDAQGWRHDSAVDKCSQCAVKGKGSSTSTRPDHSGLSHDAFLRAPAVMEDVPVALIL